MTNDFFDFSSELLSSTFQATPYALSRDADGFDENKLIIGNYNNINFPVIFKYESGKNFKDILDTGWPSLYLISDKMKTILEENHLTGWQTFPIKLYDKRKNEVFGYQGFSVTGKCALINYEKSPIIEKRVVSKGPLCQFYKGIIIDEWDGKDFFISEGTRRILISRRSADILLKEKINNLELIHVNYVEKSVDSFLQNKLNK